MFSDGHFYAGRHNHKKEGNAKSVSVKILNWKGQIAMDRERHLYHGSIMKELDIILANAESHADGSKVAYFTSDRVYALVCCRGGEENFVTMGLKDGVQHYLNAFLTS